MFWKKIKCKLPRVLYIYSSVKVDDDDGSDGDGDDDDDDDDDQRSFDIENEIIKANTRKNRNLNCHHH